MILHGLFTKRTELNEESFVLVDNQTPFDIIDRWDAEKSVEKMIEQIWEDISGMSKTKQRIMDLKFKKGITNNREIAKKIGVSHRTVRQKFYEAIKEIRENIKNDPKRYIL